MSDERINLPESEVAGVYAVGARASDGPEIVTLDFLAGTDEPDTFQVVSRVRLPPSALDAVYLQLQEMISRRKGF